MGIKKIAQDKFEVSYSKRNSKTGQPVSLKRIVKSAAAANRAYINLIAAVTKKINEKIIPNWATLVKAYLEDAHNRGLIESTIYNIEKCLGAVTVPLWGKRLITEITTQEIRELIYNEYGKKSQSHQKNILKFIRQVFQFGVDRGDILRNPSPKLAFRIGDKIKNVLTLEQVRIFLNKAKDAEWDWYYHCAVAVYTGMRNGEVYALTWDKVNLNDRQILVNCSWNKRGGFKSTKSGDDRIVEIAPNLLLILKELKLANEHSHFVLPRMREWDVGEQARHLRMFLTGNGLPQIRFHDLRASWATIMLSKGVVPNKVMKMGGWKDLKTMMIYMRKAGIDIKGITDGLDLHNPSREMAQVFDFPQLSTMS